MLTMFEALKTGQFDELWYMIRYSERSFKHPFKCSACNGEGSWVEDYFEFGPGPSYDCGYCQGRGYVGFIAKFIWKVYYLD